MVDHHLAKLKENGNFIKQTYKKINVATAFASGCVLFAINEKKISTEIK